MPLYEYRCAKCDSRFELLRKMSEADRDLVCPDCQSREVQRLVSAVARTSGGGGGCGPAGGGGGRFT